MVSDAEHKNLGNALMVRAVMFADHPSAQGAWFELQEAAVAYARVVIPDRDAAERERLAARKREHEDA